ncbi:DNA polymerase III subunit gamma/tau [Acetobacter lambici]|uniref:DNA polymerase III subunit gamma/tau n=1 Tax=Acetobacter lambici TaxID=1332824 RepID=A0ABT1F2A4_9PROT|nr:DNA polymerase III subunit gamma/tau [Acetobacter lambici]MCP1243353.1 DNA polymerase III subunit gamma/tau [Acetobacter lambici]MCP1259330.1 DNA polymerase III subunit gamma/tau [Acetobacter lambici]NHO57581.1 DNA polymerase III subunit gamma/tau [Acetobacter lambici]
MSDTTDEQFPHDEGLPSPEPEGPGLFGEAEPPAPAPTPQPPAPVAATLPYRVLARKYRPTTFDDLIGQEAMVRTLRNAFALGRVAHAFMLTGVRGVGKTTTARIIARALNCTGPDGKGGPTADPCGVCPNCVAILNDRHPDVLEMDAASRTGVDDVREIIEATRFRPMQGRMKVFIIDEVHMLSRNAFNALLKTLEEPPAQVTFIFATTELRKVPVTVLSRCQRFDLRRVPQAELAGLFGRIAQKEQVRLSDDALALIARAADGSVRDGLSLLDQAIAQGSGLTDEGGVIGASIVSDMLGLADREVVFDLLEAVLTGKPDTALALLDAAYARGADPGLVLGDMLELVHIVSRLRAVPALGDSADMPEAERVRGTHMASTFAVPVLMRAWQMLVKGVREVESAPDRRAAADMVLIRLCYVADLPSPEDLVKRLSATPDEGSRGAAPVPPSGPQAGGASAQAGAQTGVSGPGVTAGAFAAPQADPQASAGHEPPRLRMVSSGGVAVAQPEPVMAPVVQPVAPVELAAPPIPRTWREAVALVKDQREAILHGQLRHAAHLISFAQGRIVLRLERGVPGDVVPQLRRVLDRATGMNWRIETGPEEGEPTLDAQGAEVIQFRRREAEAHPLVRAILNAFPDAQLGEVRDHGLDDYGLPPEEPPELLFAPLDAQPLDEDDRPFDPGASQD